MRKIAILLVLVLLGGFALELGGPGVHVHQRGDQYASPESRT